MVNLQGLEKQQEKEIPRTNQSRDERYGNKVTRQKESMK